LFPVDKTGDVGVLIHDHVHVVDVDVTEREWQGFKTFCNRNERLDPRLELGRHSFLGDDPPQTGNDITIHDSRTILLHHATTDNDSDLETYLDVTFDVEVCTAPDISRDISRDVREQRVGFDGMGDRYDIAKEDVGKHDFGCVDLIVF
jgi:hypothetical protein